MKKYPGFGEERTIADWARRLGIRQGVLRYFVENGEKTVEEVAAFDGVVYPTDRKPREGYRMPETRRLVAELLQRSGYDIKADDLTVKALPNAEHLVSLDRRRVGVYNYKTGWLGGLADRDALPLTAPYSNELKVSDAGEGAWVLTPETRARIRREAVQGYDAPSLDYDTILGKHSKNTGAAPEVYEYNGHRYTCAEWARRLGIPRSTLWRMLKRGYSLESIIEARK